MKYVTVITPTYNRAGFLPRLYESLKAQTDPDFEWMIVDDGSTDETEQTVAAFVREHQIAIRYLKRENGGKHRALNLGIPNIDTELTFIVDSDDYLPPDSIETIIAYHDQYKKTDNLCGYSFLRCYEDGRVNTAYFKKDGEIDSFCNVRINGHLGGDKAEVFYTEILKKYPFPEYEGEKFLPEDLVWMKMSGPYLMVHINKCIYISEYLEGGLTRTGRAMKIHSPHGMLERSLVYLEDADVNVRTNIKMMMLYIIYSKFAGIGLREAYRRVHKKLLFILLSAPSCLIKIVFSDIQEAGVG